jgi:hypothetical protein
MAESDFQPLDVVREGVGSREPKARKPAPTCLYFSTLPRGRGAGHFSLRTPTFSRKVGFFYSLATENTEDTEKDQDPKNKIQNIEFGFRM